MQARIEALAAKLAKEAPAPRGSGRGGQRAIVHIDMDCFFASVAGTQLQCVCLGLGFLLGCGPCAEASASSAHHHRLPLMVVLLCCSCAGGSLSASAKSADEASDTKQVSYFDF